MFAADLPIFQAPVVNWFALAPYLIVFGAAVIGVLVEAFAPARSRRPVQIALLLAAQIAALIMVVWYAARLQSLTSQQIERADVFPAGTALAIEPLSSVIQVILLVASIFASLVMIDRTTAHQDPFAPSAAAIPGSRYEEDARSQGIEQTEVFPLLLFTIGGMLVFPAAGDWVTMFVALEVFSLPLYALTAMARRRRLLSQEASFKYFTLGAFSSALFLFGIALMYGFTQSIDLLAPSAAVQQGVASGTFSDNSVLYFAGIALILVGIFFKIGAAPFHAWTPDVYQGAPTPITGFMAACTKIAAFGVLTRILIFCVNATTEQVFNVIAPVVAGVAIATMLVGAIMAITQTNMVRMLAYSSIGHAGFLLIPLTSLGPHSLRALAFYLLTYSFATIGAFAVVMLVRERTASGEVTGEASHIGQWAGLARRSPLLAGSMTIFLLSFAGVPLTAGFIAKFQAFAPAVYEQAWPVVIVAILASAISLFVYIRLIVLMFFVAPAEERDQHSDATVPSPNNADPAEVPDAQLASNDTHTSPGARDAQRLSPAKTAVIDADESVGVTAVQSTGPAFAVILVSAALTVILGIIPGPVLDLIASLV